MQAAACFANRVGVLCPSDQPHVSANVLMHFQTSHTLHLTGGFESGFEGSAGGGGQTREHAQLARSLGVEQVAVVVSKLDTCDFSQQRFLDIQAALLPFLKGCGFRPSALQWLPAVGPSGQNLVKRPSEPQLAWFMVSYQPLETICLIWQMTSTPGCWLVSNPFACYTAGTIQACLQRGFASYCRTKSVSNLQIEHLVLAVNNEPFVQLPLGCL